MMSAGFQWDPPWNGYPRWTHFATGVTALRQPYMTEQQWQEHKEKKVLEAQQKASSETGSRPAEESLESPATGVSRTEAGEV